MSKYVKESISKELLADEAARDALTETPAKRVELRHGAWLTDASSSIKSRRFSNPLFALVVVFAVLFVASIFLFESIEVVTPQLQAIKLVVSSLFAVSLGFIVSVWWNATARFDARIKEAERIDREYREHLMSFSDSLFDIINALNTLAAKPPKSFVVASEFLLGEYVHLLQSQLQRYGDYIAGLGFDATAFLDEKIRIFEGIRERASISIEGMPKEIESLFVASLELEPGKHADSRAKHQQELRSKLKQLDGQTPEPALKKAS
jgi:hypothetical protein